MNLVGSDDAADAFRIPRPVWKIHTLKYTLLGREKGGALKMNNGECNFSHALGCAQSGAGLSPLSHVTPNAPFVD